MYYTMALANVIPPAEQQLPAAPDTPPQPQPTPSQIELSATNPDEEGSQQQPTPSPIPSSIDNSDEEAQPGSLSSGSTSEVLIVRSLRKTIAHLKSVNVLEHLIAYDADISAGVLTRECEAIEAARQQHLLQKHALRKTNKNRKHKRDLKQLQQQDANIETCSFAMLQSGDAASAPAAETTLVKILRQPPANAQQLLGAQAQAPAFVQELLLCVLRTHDRLKLPANHRQAVILPTLKLASALVEWRVPTHVLARNR